MKALSFRICIVDDERELRDAFIALLEDRGYELKVFESATEFIAWRSAGGECDLVISDVCMPGASGYELCQALRAVPEVVRTPVILVTGSEPKAKAKGLAMGADEFLHKPFQAPELLAKIKSLLEIRAKDLQTHAQLKLANRFLSPNVAEMIALGGRDTQLQLHRSEVSVVFIDLRRFTAFAEREAPEVVLQVLGDYYKTVGTCAIRNQGTLGHLAGDGMMIFFNDPTPVKDHQRVALRMAVDVREALREQKQRWDEMEYDIDFGMGLAEGYATIGEIGFERFSQYSVIGTVVNLAARLCQSAKDGQIVISQRFRNVVGASGCMAQPIGELVLKGIEKPVQAYDVISVEGCGKRSA